MATAVQTNPKLYEAFEEEAKEINVEDLMQEMLNSFNQESGYNPSATDEIRVRKMMLARKYIEKDVEHLTLLKKAVMEEWDARINKKREEINGLNGLIEKYIKDANKGKKLSLDVGTATLRRSAPKTKIVNIEKAKAHLQEKGELQKFLKAPELDTTLLQKTYINKFNEKVEKETEIQIQQEVEASEIGKITKKREKEIKLEVEQRLSDSYFNDLPEFVEYVPESESLSITMK